ncbi:MAG: hypothetical protein ACLT38_08165 [Akkermansia sp.]
MLGITQEIAENEIIHTASELAQKKRQQHKYHRLPDAGEAASFIAREYSHRRPGGTTAIFICRFSLHLKKTPKQNFFGKYHVVTL